MAKTEGEVNNKRGKLKRAIYDEEVARLSVELVKLQEWVRSQGLRVAVVFEGRDAAGKGGVIKTITADLSPRVARIVALPAPNDRERTQWYFERYVAQLPAAGEIVLFEEMLIRSGIKLVKYWFSVSDEEQERRFQARLADPTKHWKLSPMDLEARSRWVDYSRAKDVMFAHTDSELSPWWVVEADDKRRARVNTITHLLASIPYEYEPPAALKLPTRQGDGGYVRPPRETQRFVPAVF